MDERDGVPDPRLRLPERGELDLTSIGLRARRVRLGLTQAALAGRLGVSRNTVARWERGDLPVGHPDLLQLALDDIEQIPRHRDVASEAISTSSADVGRWSRLVPLPDARALAPTRLPARPGRLIGRQRDVETALRLLREDARLVTLTGPAGAGKTRLALEVADQAGRDYRHGIVFVDLAPVRDPRLVALAISRALGAPESGGLRLQTETLERFLRDQNLLLVLDNFEQVLPAGLMLSDLLTVCPGLAMLVTSRAALRLSWEHECPVPPLELPPDANASPDLDAIGRAPAVMLFVERARAVAPDFELDATNAVAVSEICAGLDGLPLAIELAAVRVKVLSPAKLLSRLRGRFDLLDSGPRDLPARHRTLRAALDWSYDLLTESERRLFRRLSAFVGGFTLEAVEAVAGPAALDDLASLVDQSLVRRDRGDGIHPRFRLLETIRDYARERLEESGDLEDVLRSHAAYCLQRAEHLLPLLRGPDQLDYLSGMEREHDNVQTAITWYREHGDVDGMLRLCAAAWNYWWVCMRLSVGHYWLETALRASPNVSTAARACVLNGAGTIASLLGNHERAAQHFRESVELWRVLGDRSGLAHVLADLGTLLLVGNPAGAALPVLEEAVAQARTAEDSWEIAHALFALGPALRTGRGDAAALEALDETRRLFAALGDRRARAHADIDLASILSDNGRSAQAIEYARESLVLLEELGDRWGSIFALVALGHAAVSAYPDRAAWLLGVVEGVCERSGAALLPYFDATEPRGLARAVIRLGGPAVAARRAEGRQVRLSEAISAALAFQWGLPVDPDRDDGLTLTRREREVAALIARGLSNRAIAGHLSISPRTVEGHVDRIRDKLDLRSRTHLAAWAITHLPDRPQPSKTP